MLIRSCIGVAAANTRICTAMATSSAYQRHQASRSLSSICHHRHGHGRMRHMVIPTPSSSHAHTHHDGSSQSWSWSRFRSISYTSSLRSSSSSATAAAAVAGGNDGAAVLTAPHISTLMRRLYLKVHPDLFDGYVWERDVNAQSLAQLSGMLDNIKQGQSYPSMIYQLTFYLRDTHTNNDRIITPPDTIIATSSLVTSTDTASSSLTSHDNDSNDQLRWRTVQATSSADHIAAATARRNETSEARAIRLEHEAKLASDALHQARSAAAATPITRSSVRRHGESGDYKRINVTLGIHGGATAVSLAARRHIHQQLVQLFTLSSCFTSSNDNISDNNTTGALSSSNNDPSITFIWGDSFDAAMSSANESRSSRVPMTHDQHMWYTNHMNNWKNGSDKHDGHTVSLTEFLMSCRWIAWQLDARRRNEQIALSVATTNLRIQGYRVIFDIAANQLTVSQQVSLCDRFITVMQRCGISLKHAQDSSHHNTPRDATPMVFNKGILVFSSSVTSSQIDVRGRLVLSIHGDNDEWYALLCGAASSGNIWQLIDERQRAWKHIMMMEHNTATTIGLKHIFGAPHIAVGNDYLSYLTSYRNNASLFHRVIRFNPSLATVPLRIYDHNESLCSDTSLGLLNIPIGTHVNDVATYLQTNGIDCLQAHHIAFATNDAIVARINDAKRRLSLSSIERTIHVSDDDMISCLTRLLHGSPINRQLLTGAHIRITHARTMHVDESGTIHIPSLYT